MKTARRFAFYLLVVSGAVLVGCGGEPLGESEGGEPVVETTESLLGTVTKKANPVGQLLGAPPNEWNHISYENRSYIGGNPSWAYVDTFQDENPILPCANEFQSGYGVGIIGDPTYKNTQSYEMGVPYTTATPTVVRIKLCAVTVGAVNPDGSVAVGALKVRYAYKNQKSSWHTVTPSNSWVTNPAPWQNLLHEQSRVIVTSWTLPLDASMPTNSPIDWQIDMENTSEYAGAAVCGMRLELDYPVAAF